MNNNQNNNHYYNCEVSQPILQPGQVAVDFNGLAWSNSMGMIHNIAPVQTSSWETWLGTQQ
jgi:hypothetical protein